MLGLGLGLGLDMFVDTNSIQGSISVDSVCDFESCESTGSWRERQNSHRARLGCRTQIRHMIRVRVRVRARGLFPKEVSKRVCHLSQCASNRCWKLRQTPGQPRASGRGKRRACVRGSICRSRGTGAGQEMGPVDGRRWS